MKPFIDYIIFLILFGCWFFNMVNLFDPTFTTSNAVANGRMFAAITIFPGVVWGFCDFIVTGYQWLLG